MNCDDFIGLLSQVEDLKGAIEKLAPILKENGITGKVLLYCELNELKSVLNLNFGNWEIFKLLVLSLRDAENMAKNHQMVKASDSRDTNDGASGSHQQHQQSQPPVLNRLKQKSVMEKQVRMVLV